ncbi:hypothetical protein Lal_00031950 [Lupinus albus]|nr:hypothetical protein Lal_00031950 [Lupinus albus]
MLTSPRFKQKLQLNSENLMVLNILNLHTKRRNYLMKKTMNDVIYVMTNLKLAKKKKFRKANEYNMDDVDSDDDCIVENKENSDTDASNDEEFFQVGQDA